MASWIQTCQRLGVEPWRYLRDALERLPSHPPARLAELLPDEWAQIQRRAAASAAPESLGEMSPPSAELA
jgi:hypothetical protein